MFTLLMGLLGPVTGVSVTRFGPRKNIIFGNLVGVLGLVGMSMVTQLWQVYLFFGVFAGLAHTFGTYIAVTTIAHNWFIKRRPLALAMVMASGGLGGLIFSPLIAWIISSLGWRSTWTVLAIIHLILAVIIGGLVLIRDRPEDLGQIADGIVTTEKEAARLSKVYQTPVDWKVKQAMRSRAIWLIITMNVANLFILNTMAVHQVVYLKDIGFSAMTAATALGLIPGVSIISRLAFGVLASRFEARYLGAACIAVEMVAILILMNTRTLPLIYLYTVLLGLGVGGLFVASPVLIGAYYGRTHYAQIYGWTMPFGTILSSMAAPLAGAIYDRTGNYTPAFILLIFLSAVSLVAALLASPPKPRNG